MTVLPLILLLCTFYGFAILTMKCSVCCMVFVYVLTVISNNVDIMFLSAQKKSLRIIWSNSIFRGWHGNYISSGFIDWHYVPVVVILSIDRYIYGLISNYCWCYTDLYCIQNLLNMKLLKCHNLVYCAFVVPLSSLYKAKKKCLVSV